MLSILINAPNFFEAKISYKPQKFHSIEQLVQDQHDNNKSIEDNFALNDKVLLPYIQVTDLGKMIISPFIAIVGVDYFCLDPHINIFWSTTIFICMNE